MDRADLVDAELAEDLSIAVAGFLPEGRGGRDDRDRRVPAARERDEAAQDDAVTDLVLRAADDDDGSIGHDRSGLPQMFATGYPCASRRWPPNAIPALAPLRTCVWRRLRCMGRAMRECPRDGPASGRARAPTRPRHGAWSWSRGGGPERPAGPAHPATRRGLPPGAPPRGVPAARSPAPAGGHPPEHHLLAHGRRPDRPRRRRRRRRPRVLGGCPAVAHR